MILYKSRYYTKELSDVSGSQNDCSVWCVFHRALCCVLLVRQGNGVMLKSRAERAEISLDQQDQQGTRGCYELTDATANAVQRRLHCVRCVHRLHRLVLCDAARFTETRKKR